MGRLYTGSGTFTLNPENTLATFEGGTVYSSDGSLLTGHKVLMHYDNGRIYRYVDEAIVGAPVVLARCDKFGKIKSESGAVLGYCEDGTVKDRSGCSIACYEGDLYGAAAAACAVLFGLDDRSRRADIGNADADHHTSGSGSGSDSSALEIVFSIVGLALLNAGKLLRKLLKTVYIWGAYVFPLVLSCILIAPGAPVILLPTLVYLVLHTVLLLKCRKRQGKGQYRPAVISFLLYLVSFLLLGIPAVIYQMIWLVREHAGESKP